MVFCMLEGNLYDLVPGTPESLAQIDGIPDVKTWRGADSPLRMCSTSSLRQ